MNPRLYRLSETLQRIDRALRREEKRPSPDVVAVMRLQRLKLRAKALIGRLMCQPMYA